MGWRGRGGSDTHFDIVSSVRQIQPARVPVSSAAAIAYLRRQPARGPYTVRHASHPIVESYRSSGAPVPYLWL